MTAVPAASPEQSQAKSMALDYLDYTHFSRPGLIDRLVYEGFSVEDAARGPS
jgi:hypothetical protein